MSKQETCSFWVREVLLHWPQDAERRKREMVPSNKIASAPPLAAEEAPALLIRAC